MIRALPKAVCLLRTSSATFKMIFCLELCFSSCQSFSSKKASSIASETFALDPRPMSISLRSAKFGILPPISHVRMNNHAYKLMGYIGWATFPNHVPSLGQMEKDCSPNSGLQFRGLWKKSPEKQLRRHGRLDKLLLVDATVAICVHLPENLKMFRRKIS